MKLDVTLDQTDNIEMHRQFENIFQECSNGMHNIKFSGTFRFSPDFRISCEAPARLNTQFKLFLINSLYNIEKTSV